MDYFRAFLSTCLFLFSSYLVYDLFANEFTWTVLGFCAGGYIGSYYLWPKDNDFDSQPLDYLEIIVELPFQSMALGIRSIGRLIRNADADIGTDV